MERELLIGLAGTKGVGKSTVAQMLVELIPDVRVVAWADALKDDVLAMANQALHWEHWRNGGWAADFVPLTREDVEQKKAEVFGPMLQGYGALMRHRVAPDYWIRRWEQRAPSRVIAPDTRHHNEADYIKANGGVLVYIDGPSRWEGDTRSSTHESERFVVELREKADFWIANTGSLDELHQNVGAVAAIILGGACIGAPA